MFCSNLFLHYFFTVKVAIKIRLFDSSDEISVYINKIKMKIEPQHDKTNKMTVRPAKTQISLGIGPD